MNLRQIEVFRAVFMMRSVSGGARLLNVAQPSVTRMMRHLEKQLGYALFELRQGRILPTPQAEVLYRETAGLFQQVERVSALAENLKTGLGERLAVVAYYSAAIRAVPAALSAVARKFPNVSFSIDAKNPTDLIDDILNAHADVGIAGNVPDMPSIKQHLLGTDDLVAVLSCEHPAASKEEISLDDIAGTPCIAGPANSPVGHMLREAFSERGLPFKTQIAISTPLPIFELVRQLKGVALIGDMAVKHLDKADGVVIRPLTVPIRYPVSAFWSAQAPAFRARDLFVERLEAEFREYTTTKN